MVVCSHLLHMEGDSISRVKEQFLESQQCPSKGVWMNWHPDMEAKSSLLGGCGVLGVGIWLAVTQGDFATISPSYPFLSVANVLIAAGTIIMVVGFLGCLGAIKENRCLLLSFFIILLIIFTLELTGIFIFISGRDLIDKYAHRDLTKGMRLYSTEGNAGLTKAWDIVQTDFRCCGVENYTDWFTAFGEDKVPDSCCLEYGKGCGATLSKTNFQEGCYMKVMDVLEQYLLVVGIFGLCIASIQVLGMAFAMVMYCQLRKESSKYY
uniref:Tetraspanin n=1 Tax=Eptatretus burgeri TaxID=7764 RepID=A0A8C4PX53_EPTBU